ncbi:hypothetical protein Nepgr_010692 [Nepenthes gracilis]|uniref:Cytochrome P450 n=1 Tax=Nepenthes gracilis TaxID=150966 RepID=A0AAD3SDX1_NEPGR|nr:hypothetical protein Nepgr_010692 [Nepenthes gracilis]
MSWWRSTISTAEFTPLLLIFSLSLILVALYATARAGRRKIPPLPPGPINIPLVGHLPFLDRSLHTYFADLAQTYGPILSLRLGQKVCVVVSSPSIAKEVLKDNDVTFANRDVPAAAKAGVYGGISILWSPYGPEWRMLRKIGVHQMIGTAALDSAYYDLRRREVRRTVGYLNGRAGSAVNLGEQLFVTTLNVVTSMLWSSGAVEAAAERDSVGAEFRRWVEEFTAMLGKPNVSDFFPWAAWFDLQGIERRMRECSRKFDKMFDETIDQRLKSMDQSQETRGIKDVLQVLLELKDDVDAKTPLTMTHVKALFLDMILGGADTTSSTMEFAMAEIMNRPPLIIKLQEEIDNVVGQDDILEEHHIHKLPSLLAVVKETLRLHPPVALVVPHRPSKSCLIGGYTVPEGSRVFINVWSIHRDPSIWENPSEFSPERFLHGAYDFSGNDFTYLPFSSGRRICAGTAMAERIMMLTLAALLHSFDWKTAEGEKLDLEEEPGIVVRKKTPLMVIPSPRLSNPTLYK